MSLSRASRPSPHRRAVSTQSRWSSMSELPASRSVMPITPLRGVRISWLMVARNWALARAPASAFSRACTSACSVSFRCVMSVAMQTTSVAPARPGSVPADTLTATAGPPRRSSCSSTSRTAVARATGSSTRARKDSSPSTNSAPALAPITSASGAPRSSISAALALVTLPSASTTIRPSAMWEMIESRYAFATSSARCAFSSSAMRLKLRASDPISSRERGSRRTSRSPPATLRASSASSSRGRLPRRLTTTETMLAAAASSRTQAEHDVAQAVDGRERGGDVLDDERRIARWRGGVSVPDEVLVAPRECSTRKPARPVRGQGRRPRAGLDEVAIEGPVPHGRGERRRRGRRFGARAGLPRTARGGARAACDGTWGRGPRRRAASRPPSSRRTTARMGNAQVTRGVAPSNSSAQAGAAVPRLSAITLSIHSGLLAATTRPEASATTARASMSWR